MSKLSCPSQTSAMFVPVLIFFFLPLLTLQYYTYDYMEKYPNVDFCLANPKNKSYIFYYLFRSNSQKRAITMNEDYQIPVSDRQRDTKIFIHGFLENVTVPWYKLAKKQYFDKGPHNIIYVDWEKACNKFYPVASANIKPLAEYVADFIAATKVPPKKIHIITSGLAAHMAGFVGKNVLLKTGQKLGRITGTDPTGPGFEYVGPEARLSKYDADFVDVIHTDIGIFGIIKPIGQVDFYANAGHSQPRCPSRNVDELCSHNRAIQLFVESINKRNVTAKSVKLNEVGKVIPATKNVEVEFGDSMPTNVKGMYQLITNHSSPYLIPKKYKN